MMNKRNLKFLSILIIVIVWCIPAFASVSHMNCTCCTQTKSCCEAVSQNIIKIEKSESSCSKCRCNISQKRTSFEKLLVTSLTLKKNDNINNYQLYSITTPVLSQTGIVTPSQILQVKLTPLFTKNAAFLL